VSAARRLAPASGGLPTGSGRAGNVGRPPAARRRPPVIAMVGCLALLATLLISVASEPRAAAGPAGTGRFVYLETLDRGDHFRLVLADATGAFERLLAPQVYGRPALSPDGTRVAFTAPLGSGSDGRYGLFVVRVDGSGLVRLSAPAVGDFDPAWSPDGTRIAVSRDERGSFEPSCCTLWTMAADGADQRRLDGATSARQPTWSPDGQQLAYAAPEGIRAINLVGSPSRLVAAGALSWPAWSPDGARIAAVRRTGPESGTVSLVPEGGGEPVDTASGGGLPEAPVWADAQTLLHLNVWGQGENGRSRAEVRQTVVGGDSVVVFGTGRPMFYLHWWAWRSGLPQAQARSIERACPPDVVGPAGFADVPPDAVHGRAVDCVVHWRVAQGRSPSSYAPMSPVTREQMATFLAGLVERSGGTLPEPTRDHFSDDAGSVHEAAINRLAEAGVVLGRTPGQYEPKAPVSRAQMAAFLVRGYDLRAAQGERPPLPPGEDWFYDDAASPLHDDINKAAAAGFAGGTGGGRYVPEGAVRRDQMASFVARALDLVVEQEMAAPPPR
jgi:hypothetical protein